MNATFQQLAKVANFPISEKFPTFAKTRYPQAYHEGESGKSHTDRDRHADAGLAGCSPSPPPSRIQHLLRDVAGDRCADPTHARSQDVDNCHQIFVMSGRDDQSHIEPIPPIAPDTFAIAFFRTFAGPEDSGLRLSYPPFTEPFVSHGNGHSLSLRAPPVFPA